MDLIFAGCFRWIFLFVLCATYVKEGGEELGEDGPGARGDGELPLETGRQPARSAFNAVWPAMRSDTMVPHCICNVWCVQHNHMGHCVYGATTSDLARCVYAPCDVIHSVTQVCCPVAVVLFVLHG